MTSDTGKEILPIIYWRMDIIEVGTGKDVQSIKVRYLHYKHDKFDYYIATSLFDVSIEEIDEIYKKR